MSKIRSGVVLLVLLLLATPVLASDQVVAPSPTAFLADLWSDVVEIVEAVFEKSETGDESGPILDPTGDDEFGIIVDPNGEASSSEDETGPMIDPNG